MIRAEEEEWLRRLCRAWGVTGVCGVLRSVAVFCEEEGAKDSEPSLGVERWRFLASRLHEVSRGLPR